MAVDPETETTVTLEFGMTDAELNAVADMMTRGSFVSVEDLIRIALFRHAKHLGVPILPDVFELRLRLNSLGLRRTKGTTP